MEVFYAYSELMLCGLITDWYMTESTEKIMLQLGQ